MLNWYYKYRNEKSNSWIIGAISTPPISGITFALVREQLIRPYLKSQGINNPIGLTYERAKNSVEHNPIEASEISPSIFINGVKFSTLTGYAENKPKEHIDRILFCNVGWMKKYAGYINDKPIGGGDYNRKNIGQEVYNFLPDNGVYYGFVQPSGKNGTIHIEKIGASTIADVIDDVLVIWTAPNPTGGTYIVGWYKHASVYRHLQNVKIKGRLKGYNIFNISTKAENAKLLSIDERIFSIPKGPNTKGMGQSNVWYADGEGQEELKQRVTKYISSLESGEVSGAHKKNYYQTNPFVRQKVEKTAVETVWRYYENLGYELTSVEKDSVGWDLEARSGKLYYKIEVKGLSGNNISVEFTPNEYRNFKKYKDSYRVAIVANCLLKPQLFIFSFSSESNCWEDDSGNRLSIKEILSAKLFIN